MADDDFSIALEPVENLYGGGTRTRHIILKRLHGAWAQSAFSCTVRDKVAPNRDYPYEGLFAVLNGDNWKFIDAIAVGLKVGGKGISLKPGPVRASPWDCTYTYTGAGRTLRVRYFLCRAEGCLGRISASVDGDDDVSIVFEPYFDIRYMYDASRPQDHVARLLGKTLAVSVDGRTACLSLPGASPEESPHEVEWRYKLGSGDREKIGERIRPIAEARRVVSFYDMESRGNEASLLFSCAETEGQAMELLQQKALDMGEDIEDARSLRAALMPSYGGTGRERAIIWRALAMSRFGMLIDGARFEEAGDFWFKSVWFRDQFEGLIHNYDTIRIAGQMDRVRRILLESFKLQDHWGRLPNRHISSREKYEYNSADATLLAFMLAGRVVRDTNDGALARHAAHALKKYLEGISSAELVPNGPPVLKPNGMIAVPAWHSWTDGFRMIKGKRLPIRMNEDWERELLDRGKEGEADLSRYLLPEINAQWIHSLEAGWLFAKYIRDFALADRCRTLHYQVLDAYKPLFFNGSTKFLNNMATTDESALGRRTDPAIASPGMVAAAMLGPNVFSTEEIAAIARTSIDKLLRKKWGLPFGVAVRDTDRCVYYNGEDYHEGVIWPRDTPYLIRLLSLAGHGDLVKQLLDSNLKHQMEEGFVFYNNELFSCDHDWTPVKNPVQWWSQWVDPYLERRDH